MKRKQAGSTPMSPVGRDADVKIRPIRNDRDHASALERIDALWGADPGSPRGDELEVWVTLVDAYEREHHPIEAPTPIAAIP